MRNFLPQDISVEELVPEKVLGRLMERFAAFLGAEIAVFGNHGRMAGLWGANGAIGEGARRDEIERLAGARIPDVSAGRRRALALPELGEGAALVPLALDLEPAGALAIVVAPGRDVEATAELVRTAVDATLYAYYRLLLASEVQLAATEQSHSALERQNVELRQAYERLKSLDQLKSDFVANVNHELRTPLTAILGFTELLMLDEDSFDADQIESIQQIHDKASHLVKLISRVLAFTDTDAGRPRMSYSRFDMGELVREVVDDHTARAGARGIGIALRQEGESLPPVEADREKIQAVIDSLVENAVKFSGDGMQVDVVLEANRDSAIADDPFLAMAGSAGTEVLVHVIDRGKGFSAARANEVFEDFHQLDSTSTREHGGLGLGLGLARRVIELHGGKIIAQSEPERGSHFIVSLPAGPMREPGRKARRLLIVEREEFLTSLLESEARSRRWELVWAHTADDAARVASQQPVDLVLVNPRLGEDGVSALFEQLKAGRVTRDLPALVAGAMGNELDERCRALRARTLPGNALTRDDLVAAVNEALGVSDE